MTAIFVFIPQHVESKTKEQISSDMEKCLNVDEYVMESRKSVDYYHAEKKACNDLIRLGNLDDTKKSLVYAKRGMIRLNEDKDGLAKSDFLEAERLNRKNALAHFGMGILFDRADDPRSAVNAYSDALEYAENLDVAGLARYNRSLMYEKLQMFDQAISDLEYIAVNHQGTVSTLDKLSQVYFKKGDFNKSMKTLDRVIELSPNGIAYQRRGHLKFSIGDFSGSLKDLNKAFEDDSILQNANYNNHSKFFIGVLHFVNGGFGSASDAFAQFKKSSLGAGLADEEFRAYELIVGEWDEIVPILWRFIAGRAAARSDALETLEVDAAEVRLSEWEKKLILRLKGQSEVNPIELASNNRQKCIAFFFLGLDHKIKNQDMQSRDMFQEAGATCSDSSIEHRLIRSLTQK